MPISSINHAAINCTLYVSIEKYDSFTCYSVVATTIKNANVALVFTFLHKVVQASSNFIAYVQAQCK